MGPLTAMAVFRFDRQKNNLSRVRGPNPHRLLESGRGIRELRGQVFERGTARLIPTYHPAYVLRAGGEAMAEMRADLVRAKRLMAEGAP